MMSNLKALQGELDKLTESLMKIQKLCQLDSQVSEIVEINYPFDIPISAIVSKTCEWAEETYSQAEYERVIDEMQTILMHSELGDVQCLNAIEILRNRERERLGFDEQS